MEKFWKVLERFWKSPLITCKTLDLTKNELSKTFQNISIPDHFYYQVWSIQTVTKMVPDDGHLGLDIQ